MQYCQWDPQKQLPIKDNETGHAEASWMAVYSLSPTIRGLRLYLCDACIALPVFDKTEKYQLDKSEVLGCVI